MTRSSTSCPSTMTFVSQGNPSHAHNLSLGPVAELAIAVYDRRDGSNPRIDFDANQANYTAEVLASHQRRFLGMLAQLLMAPGMPLHRLEILGPEERHMLLKEFNDTARPLPEATLPQLFEAQVERDPQAIALVFDEKSLTYQELNARANRLAEYLRREGVGVGASRWRHRRQSRVALCMDRSMEMIVGMLAILKAGGVYVPLDPGYPAERLAFLLTEVAAPVILTVAEADASLPASGAKVICLDRDWALMKEGHGAQNPSTTEDAAFGVTSRDLAYVIFTSGSTGAPKGVAVPHCAITRLVLNANYVELGPTGIAHLSNVCFDAATFEIWGALLTGASVVLVPKAVALDPDRFGAELERRKVTTLFVTTALFNELAAANARIFQSVKQVLFGGEAVNPESVRRVLESGGRPRRLLHVYGPTECTTFATFHLVSEVEKDATTIPIGRPIANTTAYMLDKHGNPLPIGVPGELYLGGPGVAQGYLNEPELTAERFVADPFAADKTQRMYRTGDIVRYLPDGNIDFIGRLDDQVKIRGFRIEPGEIECVLRQHPGVAMATVIVRQDNDGGKRLVAYLVLANPEEPPQPGELREFLRQRLPDYTVPSAYVFLGKLPLTASGKIDRKALPAPVLDRELGSFIAPRSETEKTVAETWSAVLQIQGVGVHHDFFQLGGHSLLATRVVSKLRSIVGIDIPLSVFFENATVAAIAAYIDGARLTTIEPSVDPLIEREEVVI